MISKNKLALCHIELAEDVLYARPYFFAADVAARHGVRGPTLPDGFFGRGIGHGNGDGTFPNFRSAALKAH